MATPLRNGPQNPPGSNAQVAEAGLDVENEFAELDGPTARRMSREAAANVRQNGGRSAMEMLGSPVEDD